MSICMMAQVSVHMRANCKHMLESRYQPVSPKLFPQQDVVQSAAVNATKGTCPHLQLADYKDMLRLSKAMLSLSHYKGDRFSEGESTSSLSYRCL